MAQGPGCRDLGDPADVQLCWGDSGLNPGRLGVGVWGNGTQIRLGKGEISEFGSETLPQPRPDP